MLPKHQRYVLFKVIGVYESMFNPYSLKKKNNKNVNAGKKTHILRLKAKMSTLLIIFILILVFFKLSFFFFFLVASAEDVEAKDANGKICFKILLKYITHDYYKWFEN